MSKKMICKETEFKITVVDRAIPLRIRPTQPKRVRNISSTAETLPSYVLEVINECVRNRMVSADEVLSPSRMKHIVECRFLAMYICMTKLRLSTVQTGILFNRDHSTAIYARECISDWIEYDKKLRERLIEVENNLAYIQSVTNAC